MPLTNRIAPCGETTCENQTFYYKIVWIPYPEGFRVSTHRGGRGKEGRLFLCPEHYSMSEEKARYELGDVVLKLEGIDDF